MENNEVQSWLEVSLTVDAEIAEAASEVLICLDTVALKFQSFLSETRIQTTITVSAVESFPAPVRKVLSALKSDLRASLPPSSIRWNHFIKDLLLLKKEDFKKIL